MFKEFLKRKLSHYMSVRTNDCAYIQFVKGREDPFVVRTYKTNSIVDSFDNLKEAITKMNSVKSFPLLRTGKINENKNREIVVHMRMQKGLDKQQLMDYVMDKFNLMEQDAERFFFEAFPDGLDLQEEQTLDSLESVLTNVIGNPISAIEDSFNSMLTVNKEYLNKDNSMVKDNIQIVVASLLKKRNLI